MNQTYTPDGALGGAGFARQQAQDKLATENAAAGTEVQRAVAKSGAAYNNASWDLADAVREGKVKLSEIKDEDLPASMRDLPAPEREKFVQEQLARRQELATKIQQLNADRAKYLVEYEKQQAEQTGEETLESAAIRVVRGQLQAKGFEV